MASILNLAICVLLAVVLQPDGAIALKCHTNKHAPLDTKHATSTLPTLDDCDDGKCEGEPKKSYEDFGKTATAVCVRIRYETGNAVLQCGTKGMCKRNYGYAPDEKDKTKGLSKLVKTCEECDTDYCFTDGATGVAANLVLSMISLFVVCFAKRIA